jgi:hypothetical protein
MIDRRGAFKSLLATPFLMGEVAKIKAPAVLEVNEVPVEPRTLLVFRVTEKIAVQTMNTIRNNLLETLEVLGIPPDSAILLPNNLTLEAVSLPPDVFLSKDKETSHVRARND